MLTAILLLYSILIFVVFPLRIRGHNFISINQGYILVNIALYGLPPISFKITIDEGLVLTVGNKKIQLVKEKFIHMAKDIRIDTDTLRLFTPRGFNVRGIFGGDDAAFTALGCTTATLIFKFINYLLRESANFEEIIICPDYNNARLELEINIVMVTSISMIIYAFFRILKNRRDKYVKRSK